MPAPNSNKAVAFGCEPAAGIAGVRVVDRMPAADIGPPAPINVRFEDEAAEAAAGPAWSEAQADFVAREEAPPLTAHAVSGATCLFPALAVVAPGNIIVRETWTSKKALERVAGFAEAKRKQLLALRREGKRVRVAIDAPSPLAGDHFLLSSSIYGNYFHWLVECLPKVALWHQTGEGRRLLTPPLTTRWHAETLAFAGVPRERCVEVARNVSIEGEVIFSDRVSTHPARISASIVPFMRSLGDRARRSGPQRRLYISRAGAEARRLLNEDDVYAALEPLGFARVALETLPFAEQVAAFANAEMVVAPHGAGLANMAFCRPGTVVVEIGHDGMRDGRIVSFAALARCFGVRHAVVVGHADLAASAAIKRGENHHFRVRPDAVLRLLEDLAETA